MKPEKKAKPTIVESESYAPQLNLGRPADSWTMKRLRGTLRRDRQHRRSVDPTVTKERPELEAELVRLMDFGDPARDYVALADDYAARALADKAGSTFSIWVRKAAARYVKDRKRAQQPDAPYLFDGFKASRACQFIEQLPHVEGKWDTRNIVLHPSHVFFLVNLFGFRNRVKPETRRFSSALFAVARKNAKSTLAAAVMLYCLCEEQEVGPQVISAATTGSQARIIFNIARRMVEMSHGIAIHYKLAVYANAIVNASAMGNFRPINAKASTQDGLNPSHCCLDEIHAHKTHDLLNVLQSAAGARSNPLWLYTTTEGYESPGPWGELRQFGEKLLDGVVEADHFFVVIYGLDEEQGKPGEAGYKPEDDDFDESKWVKANPLIDVNPVLLAELRKAAKDARAMPGRHAEFKIKRLNKRASAANSWINLTKWRACSGTVNLDELRGAPCWGGLDLASTTDLCVFRLLWRRGGKYYTWAKRYVPASAVKQRTERGSAPYAAWVASGFITQTAGDVVDYAVIERDVVELWDRFGIKEIAFDRWNATDLSTRLIAKGLPMVEFRQGIKSYHPAMQELERQYINGNLVHGGDPVLTWCASNVVPRRDPNMNMAPDRESSTDKIDDIVALLMAMGRASLEAGVEGLEAWLAAPVHV